MTPSAMSFETINAELHRVAQEGALALVELERNSERNALFVIGDSVAAPGAQIENKRLEVNRHRAHNGTHAKLCGQGPRAETDSARRLPPRSCEQRLANCNRRDAAALAMKEAARLPDRSRAASASA